MRNHETDDQEDPKKVQLKYLIKPTFLALIVLLTLSWIVSKELNHRSEAGKSAALAKVFPVKMARAAQPNPGTTAWIQGFIREKYNIHPDLAEPRTALEGAPIKDFEVALEELEFLEGFQSPGVFAEEPPIHQEGFLRSAGQFKFIDRNTEQTTKLIYTRRSRFGIPNLDAESKQELSASDLFIHGFSPLLTAGCSALSPDWEDLSPDWGGIPKYRIIRIYALAEDGTILACPKHDPEDSDSAEEFFKEDFQSLSSNSNRPHFLSNGFYFNFDEEEFPQQGKTFNFDAAQTSGIVIDSGSGGVINTMVIPGSDRRSGQKFILSIDISLFVDWENAQVDKEAPIVRYVKIPLDKDTKKWKPWSQSLTSLEQELGMSIGEEEKKILGTLRLLTSSDEEKELSSVYYQEIIAPEGEILRSIALYRVSPDYWLLALLPEINPPPISYSFISIVLALLMAWGIVFAWARKDSNLVNFERLERLINGMEVPLVVYSNDEDQNIYGNKAAQRKGIKHGQKLRELIPERAREYYAAMQDRYLREYGIPLAFVDGERHTLIRSVTVTEPIRALHAKSGDRMAIFFPIRPDRDLQFYDEELQGKERSRLAQIFSHGIIHMSRTLSQRLTHQSEDPLTHWLADYLCRRFKVAERILHHWGSNEGIPGQGDYFYRSSDFEAHFKNLQEVFRIIRDDDDLRAEFRWTDSVLTEAKPRSEVFVYELDWGNDFNLHCPIKDGVAFLLEELLVNAVKYGLPGSQPKVTLIRSGRTLNFRVTNELTDEALEKARGHNAKKEAKNTPQTYRGLDLSREIVRLFGWGELKAEGDKATEAFVVSWSAPLSESAEL